MDGCRETGPSIHPPSHLSGHVSAPVLYRALGHSALWQVTHFRTNVPCGCSKSARPRPDCGRLGGGPWAMARWRWRSWYPTDGLDETGQGSSPRHTLLEALSGVFSRRLSVRHVMSSTSLAAAASGSLPLHPIQSIAPVLLPRGRSRLGPSMASGNRNLEVTCMWQSKLELQTKAKKACEMYQFEMPTCRQIVILVSHTQISPTLVSSFGTRSLVPGQCSS